MVCGSSSAVRAEKEVLVSISELLGRPIVYARRGGGSPPGVEEVSIVYLPACAIRDQQIDVLVAYLRRLPGLVSVDVRQAKISSASLQRMQGALPGVAFGWVQSDDDVLRTQMVILLGSPFGGQPPPVNSAKLG